MAEGDATPRAIGIDVGGTKIAGAVVDLRSGSVQHREAMQTEAGRGGAAVLDDVRALASRLVGIPSDDGERAPIGIAVCELVDPSGAVTSSQTLDWLDRDLAGVLADVGPATIASDVRAGAGAEARFGAGRDVDPFVYVSVGTGVSSTLVQGGRPYAGRHGSALVAASGTFSTTCPHCGELVDAIPEDIASGLGMTERMRALDVERSYERAEDVLAAADAGDVHAERIVDEGGRMLGTIVAGLINVLDPEAVVIGGGLGLATGRYRERFNTSLAEHIWAPTSRATPVLDAALGPDAVLIGAALAAADEQTQGPGSR
ncbi:MAG TPA: ROK family protein [Actinomycetota bacterium]